MPLRPLCSILALTLSLVLLATHTHTLSSSSSSPSSLSSSSSSLLLLRGSSSSDDDEALFVRRRRREERTDEPVLQSHKSGGIEEAAVDGVPTLGCRTASGASDGWFGLKINSSTKFVWSSLDSPSGSFSYNANDAADDLRSTSSPVGATLQALWDLVQSDAKEDVGYFYYNDEIPEAWHPGHAAGTERAHSKGVLAFTPTGGFWLVHSVPRFPLFATYSYPDNEHIYAQSFLCLSLDISQIELVAQELYVAWPQVYEKALPHAAAVLAPTLALLFDDKHSSSTTVINKIVTRDGVPMTALYKSASWGMNLYEELVAPKMQCSLLVETWMRPHTPSCCKPTCPVYQVVNVATLIIDGMAFRETQDHSKWCISSSCESSDNDVWCIGGINRQDSQRLRGGGTVCGHSPTIHSMFAKIINSTEACGACDVAAEMEQPPPSPPPSPPPPLHRVPV